jgi:phenylpyruvate tautomerase
MPHLHIHTNQTIDEGKRADFLAAASRLCSELLGKSEEYIMVTLEQGKVMGFAGSAEPTAFLRLTSLGMDAASCPHYSDKLCAFFHESIGVPTERIYIEFHSPDRAMYGWNRKTFA